MDGAVGSRGVIGGLGSGWCWGWGWLGSVRIYGGAVAGADAVVVVVVVIALERGDEVVDVDHDGVEHHGDREGVGVVV